MKSKEDTYLVGFLDILGFKSSINDFINSGDRFILEKLRNWV